MTVGRLKTLLYNAITMLEDEERYDVDKIFQEVGITADEYWEIMYKDMMYDCRRYKSNKWNFQKCTKNGIPCTCRDCLVDNCQEFECELCYNCDKYTDFDCKRRNEEEQQNDERRDKASVEVL